MAMGFHAGPGPDSKAADNSEEEGTETVDATELLSDLATTLHHIARTSKEAKTIREAVNALVRHDLMKDEL